MNIEDFVAGTWQKGYEYRYFLPNIISNTYVWTDETLNELLEQASIKIGELNSFSRFVPDIDMFILMHITKEAVVSNRIEGTKTEIDEAFYKEEDILPEKRDDWKEVNNYIKAMNYAIKKLDKLPVSNRLLKEVHKILLSSVRGEHKEPGEFRRSQNWIGGTTLKDAVFIPPIHTEIPELLSDLEKFLHNPDIKVPFLIRIAIAHYQFETIHPFLDGNGRVGRLLITLYLVSKKLLSSPLLYLSDFFEKHKSYYYDNFTFVREKNNLLQWLKFFLTAIIETSNKSMETLGKIINLKHSIEEDHLPDLGRRYKSGKMLFNSLFTHPVVDIKQTCDLTELSPKAAGDLVQWFCEKGILTEITGSQRNRLFSFREYIRFFKE